MHFSTLQLKHQRKAIIAMKRPSYFIESLQYIQLEALRYKKGQICLSNNSCSVLTQCHTLEPFFKLPIEKILFGLGFSNKRVIPFLKKKKKKKKVSNWLFSVFRVKHSK